MTATFVRWLVGSHASPTTTMATTTATAAAIKTILGTMTFGAGTSVEVAQQMLQAFGAAGHVELDTAIMYVGGTTERILGDLKAAERFALASKANPKFDTVTKLYADHYKSGPFK